MMVLVYYDYIVTFKGYDYVQPPTDAAPPADNSNYTNSTADDVSAIINSNFINTLIFNSTIDNS